MRKKGVSYIVTAVILIAGLLLLQYNKPKTINWFESYVNTHKIPYGTIVANQLMTNTLFKGKVEQVYQPPYEFLSGSDSIQGLYVFVNNGISFEKSELNKLLEWTAKGNKVFIASENFEENLSDTLNFETGYQYGGFEIAQKQEHRLVNPSLKRSRPFTYEKKNYVSFFKSIDTMSMKALATVQITQGDSDEPMEEITTVKTAFGKGQIILSTFPKGFTNYFILKDDNKDYTAGLLSYFGDSQRIYMDNYYKSGKSFYTSPMYIFLNTKELKWAYYTVLIGGLLYIIFEGKRKQRYIPVVKPLQNQTLAFTRTISDMYFEKGDRKSISEHKINYFLNYIKSRYYLIAVNKEEEFYKNVSARSGNDLEETTRLFNYMDELRGSSEISESQLIKLNKLIQKFKSKSDGK
ncbi:DUF4350 domain-containing protein [Maribacter cobaltidurans]|uniref:Uncharacterized protein n=1 Tax=Maribacter cobaltidurans TaxID=1178778 RepID=A0A223V816_9FLAO|nr:DUF4350 domain-containing protein [Maribacter cobaltidurans]ASV31387.1 hypothetical protein CJ263_14830 [Maribacter cobaltidurans]GGD82694.1 hypothetical protein GCM10011412_20580 [Maribacter cobaltidurans]